MERVSPHTPEQRAEADRLLRDTAMPMVEIGRALGISPKTISTWNAAAGWRRPRGLSALSPANWPLPRREAVARLYYEPRNSPQDIAESIGVGRTSASAFFRACGLTLRRPAAGAAAIPLPLDPASAADGPALRAALRGHVARQIAAFDAALQGNGAAVIDSARVLRDLGGLKRLLDELGTVREYADGAAPDEPEADDLPALRAEIARRFGGEPRRLAGPAGCPAAAATAPDPGARP